ncbi:hypothetical protein AALP_AA3G112900 [Arabis alpina]|uniref:S-protein homolog n=1 Tax=Arabis alpina TaxID=50452 RepID=A0A087H8I3_ARAAL|nr:hypothetical protein AALP_AA3G112900 [Arabis alpina]
MFRLVIFLIVCGLCTENAIGGSVFIYNNLDYPNLLKVYCRSGENSLGNHVRKVGGLYNFRFRDNIFGHTMFTCTFWKGHLRYTHNVTIIVYEGKKLPKFDNWVRWVAKEQGIFRSVNGEEPFKFVYKWNAH